MSMKHKAFAVLSAIVLLGSSLALGNDVQAKEQNIEVAKEREITYTDVPKDHYAYDAIMYLTEQEIISGYGNGKFGFQQKVTRGQVAALISRYLKLDTSQVMSNPYSDVKGTMFEKAILAVSENGYMGGKGGGKFDPNGFLTRAEMAVVLTKLFGLTAKTDDLFWDMSKKHWANQSIQALYSNGITLGSGNNKYMPNATVTREQYAEFLYRGIHVDQHFVPESIPAKPGEKPKPVKPKPEKPVPEPTPPVVYVDGVKVNYPVQPIILNGTTLVPIRETFVAMGVKVVWNQAEGSVYASKGKQKARLIVGSTKAWSNDKEITLNEPPIVHKDKTMIPLRFVSEAFEGKISYNNAAKEIRITMPMTGDDFLEKEQSEISNIKNAVDVQLLGDRRLMVSDNPETLDSYTIRRNNATLWNDVVNEDKESMDHRIFGWHANQFAEDVIVGITIENLSETNTIEIIDQQSIDKISPRSYRYEVGLPIAKAVLNNQLSTSFVRSDSQEILIDSFTLKPKDMVGFINDFTVRKSSGSGTLNYIIRTVVTRDNSELTTIKSLPVDLDNIRRHPRGVWNSAELMVTFPTYDMTMGTEQSYNISNGLTDNLMNEATSLVTNADSLANRGHFGAVYTVKIPYVNNLSNDKKIRVRVGSRGGIYTGVVKTEKGVFSIPSLNAMVDVVNLVERKVTDESGVFELQFMHAGGSNLPIAISIDTVD